MSKDDLKNVKEYRYLKRQLIIMATIIAVYIGCVALGTIPFWFDIPKAVLVTLLAVAFVITIVCGPYLIYFGVEIIRIKKGRDKYELAEATVATSYLSGISRGFIGKKLQCSAYLVKNKEKVDFNVYIVMYENGIELKNGDIVSIWYNEHNNHALFITKK